MDQPETFREKLAGADIADTNDGPKYRDTIQKMLDKKLSLTARVIYGLISLISAAVTLYFANLVFKANYGGDFPAFLMLLMSGAGLLFSSSLTFFAGWSAMTAKVKGRFYPGFIFGSSAVLLCYFWVALFYMMFILPIMMELFETPDASLDYRPILGIQVMLLGFFAMVAIGFIFLFRLLSDLKFTHQSKLLQIEYKLCELMEKVTG